MLLATAVLTTSFLGAPQLGIDQVAPEQTVLLMSLSDVGAMLDRLKETPAGDNLQPINDMKDGFMDGLPDSMSDAWEESMEDVDFIEMLGQFQMGMAIYSEIDKETTAVTIGLTMCIHLGEAKEAMGTIWDQAMEDVEEDQSDNFEIIELAETEVIRIDSPAEEDEEEEDPFGGGGFGMGMDFESAMPDRFYMVRVDEHILLSTSRSQMVRMLDILAGEEVEGGIGETEPMKGMTGYIGEGGLRMVLLTDHLGEMMQAFAQPFMVNMVSPMVVAMFGKIEAIGVAFEAAKEPALVSFRMGAWIPEGKSGLMKLMSRNSPREPIPGWVTAETFDYGRINFDFEGVVPWLNDVINSQPHACHARGAGHEGNGAHAQQGFLRHGQQHSDVKEHHVSLECRESQQPLGNASQGWQILYGCPG